MKNNDIFPFDEVCGKLKVSFKNKELLKTAFTHAAYANVFSIESNQRMEFLGDSVLGLIVSDFIYKNADLAEGESTRIKSSFVAEAPLAEVVERLNLNKYLIVNKGSINQELHKKSSVKADLFESIVAAIYLDGGLNAARKFVLDALRLNKKSLGQSLSSSTDYKTRLQEMLQKDGKVKINYKTVKTEGQAHEPKFVTTLLVEGEKLASAEGTSKRRAEQDAARLALDTVA